MRRRTIVALSAAGVAAVAAASSVLYLERELRRPLDVPVAGLVFEIEQGASVQRIAASLGELGALRRPVLMRLYARLTGRATRIHAGEYRIEPGTSIRGLVEQLVAGDVVQHRFTIVEGWSFRDLLPALRAHEAIAATGIDTPGVMSALGRPDVHPEGQFLPETYTFPRGTTDVEILRIAHEAMQVALDAAWRSRSLTTEVETPYEALILASIIEKETALASERRLISGVFNRRLARGMRLETDPTVIYGLGDSFDGNLRRTDLAADTPYNTYTRFGLPPTPIAMPGRASLEAAVDPADGDALFFVATGLADGSHRFSRTYEEHVQALREYNERQRREAR